MIDFTGQVAVVSGAGRGLGRLYAIELAGRGAAVVVNDTGATMHGEGADPSVAEEVVDEIEHSVGVALAAHGILANTVLPFGYSRMVSETVNDPAYLERSGFLNASQPEGVVAIVVFLASRACTFSHHDHSACAGRFARVFVGLADGWLAESGTDASVEDIAAHLSAVSATEPCSIPESIVDEVLGVCERLGVTP